MPTITSAASGNWSAGATWAGGVAPTSADNVILANTHVVTLDTTSCAALDVTVNSGATLTCSTTASSRITTQTFIHMADATATVNFDVSSNPAITCEVRINANNSTGHNEGQFRMRTPSVVTFRGAPRKRNTRLTAAISAGATNAFVADASGWRVGDIVVFAQTTAYSAAQVQADEVVLTSVIGNAIAWTGGITYAHCLDCPVGNFTSNMVFRPNTGQQPATVRYLWSSGTFAQKTFQDVAFLENGSNGDQNTFAFYIWAERGMGGPTPLAVTLDSCAFYKFGQGAVGMRELSRPLHVLNSAFYAPTQTRQYASAIHAMGNSYDCGGADSCGFYGIRSSLSVADFGGGAVTSEAAAQPYVRNSTISGCYGPALYFGGKAGEIENVDIFSSHTGLQYRHGTFSAKNLSIGTFNGGIASCFRAEQHEYLGQGVIADSTTQTLSLSNLGTYQQLAHSITWLNKNKDVTQQEIYRPFMSIKRENVTKNRSTSSIAIAPTKLATACQRTLSIPCAAGASVRVIGYVQKSHASNVAASVALTGLGSAWGGFTAANNTAWQVWDTGNITNTSGADGNFTLTYEANSSSGLTNAVYFDGVPDVPFVTKCRHYGFVFDESNPARVVNPATDVSSEATALGYTGVTINTVTPQITVGAGTANTFKKLYDYTQAWACQTANLPSPVLLTSTDGNNFALPTNCRLSWPTMGADGTLVGGRLLLAATGTHTYKLSGTVIEFQAAGIYGMGATAFSGTVELVNTSGGAVTVQLPAGTSYTNTGPNITVSTPTVNQSVAVNGVTAGSRVQIYDTTNSVELFNGTSGYSWTDPVPAAAPRNIRVRIAYQSGTSAKNFIEANIGTCGVTAPSNAVAYLASQTDDAVYNANGLDGSAVTGITISDGIDRMVINIAGGSVSWPQIYAYNVHWLTTAAGIVDDGSIITATDNANYRVTLFKIRNSSTAPLSITGGYGVDSATGTVPPLIDTIGSSGNIYQTPDHVIPYQTTGSYAITGDISTVLAAIPSAISNADAVRTELSTELARIDVAVSSVSAGSAPSAAAVATAVRSELNTELARIDVATSSRLPTAGYTAPTTPPTAATIADAVWAKTLP